MSTMALRERRGSIQDQERFYNFFRQHREDIDGFISRLPFLCTYEQTDAIEHCQASIARLNAEVHDAGPFLPAYDRRSCTDQIKRLSDYLQRTRESITPRQRFVFKTRKNDSALSLPDIAAATLQAGPPGMPTDSATSSPPGERTSTDPSFLPLVISDRRNAVIRLTSNEIMAPKTTLSHLEQCVIDLHFKPTSGSRFASADIKDVTRCLLLLGSIGGPAHLTNIRDSVIVVSCHQFRLHDAVRNTVYVSCASTPVIEKCQQIRFAPLPDTMVSHNAQFSLLMLKLDGKQMNWSKVDDFDWLQNTASPNWSVLEKASEKPSSVWDQVTSEALDAHEILALAT